MFLWVMKAVDVDGETKPKPLSSIREHTAGLTPNAYKHDKSNLGSLSRSLLRKILVLNNSH